MKTIKVNIVTPDGPVCETDANVVIAVTETGEIGILPGHIAMVAPLQIGALRLKKDDATEHIAVHGGFLEVRPDVVTVLAQSAEMASSIDIARAQAAAKRAEDTLRADQDESNYKLAELELKRALTRIDVYETRKK
ncbi:F0F1 ATP synthase subunit epsilon [Sporosarcina beigongshangi]|uniref:F0F1 ATP synthase subunit epsilon n=1 Tax=Sporosarcina beigongshangi TaxID=2782538 RepID=UPI00193AB108|nr:F0F1 ATP synthase subunit epsilon [Sporosarcina beigongshangi]